MADIINLRGVRKKKNREARQVLAVENRLKHGRTRAERERAEAEHDLENRRLDDHRLNDRPET